MYPEIEPSARVYEHDFLLELDSIPVLPKTVGGFSLVEVVMALGLCAFALVSLVSLMPVSLDYSRRALEISRVSKAFQKVGSELTQSTFSSVEALSATSPKWYFDYDGNATDKVVDRYYTITATVDASPIQNQPSASLLRVKLESVTPTNASAGSATFTICDMGY
jgi:uncharacterized protein (TIGR02598 family)